MKKDTEDIRHRYNISTFDYLRINYWGIAKCGHSTLKVILYRADNPREYKHLKNTNSSRNIHGNPIVKWIYNKCKYISPKDASKNGYMNFTVLRNPIQRACSMYNNAVHSPGRVDNSGSREFKKEANILFEQRKQTPTMLDFLNLIGRYPDKDRNRHYRSQKSYCLLNDIIKLNIETISSTIKLIHPSLVVDIQLNASGKHQPPDNKTLEKIHEIYTNDFNLWEQSISIIKGTKNENSDS